MTEGECNGRHEIRLAVLEAMLTEKIRGLTDCIELRFQGHERAMQVQTLELARRLDFLNGEADRLQKMQATYVPREVYDGRHDELVKAIRSLETFQANILGRIAVAAVIGGIVSSVVVAVVAHWILQ